MPKYNRLILMGHLCRDTELRAGQKATVATNTLAVNGFKGKDGKEPEATFVPIIAFHETAKRMADWGHKGRAIHVEGKIHQDRWTDKDTGKELSRLVMWVDSFQMLDREEPAAEPEHKPKARDQGDRFITTDDIPF